MELFLSCFVSQRISNWKKATMGKYVLDIGPGTHKSLNRPVPQDRRAALDGKHHGLDLLNRDTRELPPKRIRTETR